MSFERNTDNADDTIVFGFVWDSNNANYHPNPEYQSVFFRAQEAYFNDRLRAGKFLVVNDVLDAFSVPRMVRGMSYGWDSDEHVHLQIRLRDDQTVVVEFRASNIYKKMGGK